MLFGAHRAGCCCGEDCYSSIGCVHAALTRRKRQIIFSKPVIAAGSQSSSLQLAVLGSVCRIAYETLAVQMYAFVVSLTRIRGVASEGAPYRSPPRDQGAPPNLVSCVDLEESYTSHCDGNPYRPEQCEYQSLSASLLTADLIARKATATCCCKNSMITREGRVPS